jgi:hypothetical protein
MLGMGRAKGEETRVSTVLRKESTRFKKSKVTWFNRRIYVNYVEYYSFVRIVGYELNENVPMCIKMDRFAVQSSGSYFLFQENQGQ